MKLLSLLIVFAFISPLNYAIEVDNNGTYENACRYNVNGFIYLHIEGEPYERGYQHGYLLYAEIADIIFRDGFMCILKASHMKEVISMVICFTQKLQI